MPLKRNKKPKTLILRDFIFILLFIGVALDLVFLHFFLFDTPDRRGVYLLKIKKPIQATEQFQKAIEERPFSHFSHLNLGLSYDLQTQPLKAIEKYKWVIETFMNLPEFAAYFNLGELNGRLGYTEKALKNYQSALAFQLDTKKIKQNIELLLQKNKKSKKKQEKQKEQEKQKQQKSKSKNSSSPQDKGSQDTSQDNKNSGDKGSQLTKEQRRAILKEIEKQESKVRARQFRKKTRSRNRRDKDW